VAIQYRIGEFSNLSGVSTKSLRFYDQIGLLRPASVDSRTRYRHYHPQPLEELASIIALKNLGVPFAGVRHLLSGVESGKSRRDLLTELKRTIEQSIQTAAQTLQRVNAALDELDADNSGAVPVASVRAIVKSYAEILRFEQELLNTLPRHCVGDLRGVLWHRCGDSGALEGEPFVALKHRVPLRSYYDVSNSRRQSPARILHRTTPARNRLTTLFENG
jgi:DNA-binding transcriptional MerR regulator